MSQGSKESKEIVRLVVALVNVLADLGGTGVSSYIEKVAALVKVVPLVGPAVNNASGALAEGVDGYSAAEKAELYAEIEALELPSEVVEKVAEAVLKAGVALTDLVAIVQDAKQVVAAA
jgi:hypothetical protein